MRYNNRLSWLSGLLCAALACLISACATTNGSRTAGTATTTQKSAGAQTSSTTASHATILPTLPLTQIHMTDTTHGWALDKNNVLKTSDGGKSWVVLTPKEAVITPATQVEFLNAQYAWVAVPNENAGIVTIFYTTTGGATWNKSIIREAAPDGGLLTFLNNKIGWFEVSPGGPGAGSEGVDIFRTDNGGVTWNKIASSSDAQSALPIGGIKSGLSFKDALTGWATGTDASNAPWLYVTYDGGRTWSQQAVAGLVSSPSAGYQTTPPVLVGDDGFLPLVIMTSSPSTILVRTNDGGKTWSASGQATAPFLSSNLYVLNTRFAWATDQNSGDVFQTRDGGKTWQKVASHTNLYGPMSFVNINTGFATGRAGQTVLKRTDDGGKIWQTISYQIHA